MRGGPPRRCRGAAPRSPGTVRRAATPVRPAAATESPDGRGVRRERRGGRAAATGRAGAARADGYGRRGRAPPRWAYFPGRGGAGAAARAAASSSSFSRVPVGSLPSPCPANLLTALPSPDPPGSPPPSMPRAPSAQLSVVVSSVPSLHVSLSLPPVPCRPRPSPAQARGSARSSGVSGFLVSKEPQAVGERGPGGGSRGGWCTQ